MSTLYGIIAGLTVSFIGLVIYLIGYRNGYRAAEAELTIFTEGMRSVTNYKES